MYRSRTGEGKHGVGARPLAIVIIFSFDATDAAGAGLSRAATRAMERRMTDEHTTVEVRRNGEDEQFEAHAGGYTGVLTYSEKDGKLYLLHTEVPEELEGQGVGSRLVRASLDYAREHRLRVVPFCPFAKAYIQRHSGEFGDLVDDG